MKVNKSLIEEKTKKQLYAWYFRLRGKGDYWIPSYKWQLVEWLVNYYANKPEPNLTKPAPKQVQLELFPV